MSDTTQIDNLSEAEVRALAKRLMGELQFKQATIDKLTHENAVLKRLKFAAQSERFSAEQKDLLEETLEADLQAVAQEIEQLQPTAAPRDRAQPKRQVLPAGLPRREIRHEPDSTICTCGCRGPFDFSARSDGSRPPAERALARGSLCALTQVLVRQ